MDLVQTADPAPAPAEALQFEDLRRFFDTSDQSIFVLDRQGRFLTVNNTFARTLSRPPDGFDGLRLEDMVHPEDYHMTLRALAALLHESGPRSSLGRFQCGDGSYLWLRWRMEYSEKRGKYYGIARPLRGSDKVRRKHGLLVGAGDGPELPAGQIAYWEMDVPEGSAGEDAVVTWSDEMYRLLGLDPDSEAPSLERYSSFLGPEDREELKTGLAEVLHGAFRCYHHTLFLRDGSLRQVTWYARRRRDAVQRRHSVIGMVTDVTEHRRAEQNLQRQAAVFSSIADAIVLVNTDGAIVDWNSAAERIFGRKAADILGHAVAELRLWEQEPLERAVMEALTSASGRWSAEMSFVRVDGSRGICETIVIPQRDAPGRHIGTICIHRDVTATREAEGALRQREALYRRIVETANDGIWMVDEQGRTTFCNPALAAMMGVPAAELAGKSIFDFLDSAERIGYLRRFALCRHNLSGRFEQTFRRPDGGVLRTSISASPLFDNAGQFSGCLAIIADSTARNAGE